MKILVVGGGGREHAIIKKIKENEKVTEIFAAPGNGGIAEEAVCVDIGAKDIEGMTAFALREGIDYCVVAPDDPLVLGMVDALEENGIPCFGPDSRAAVIEGSKVFAKELMKKYGIPTAAYEVFDDLRAALEYVKTCPLPAVVKADGLALGKGVLIAPTREEAAAAVKAIMEEKRFGSSGDRVVIEEFLTGPEVTVLAFTDGRTIVPMVSSMDHKRIGENDEGPNTGGMGVIAPNPFYTEDVAAECMERIFLPTVEAMNREGRTFKGCLYFGLMLTGDGPRVIEYNSRFGDPEAQTVLPLLETDLLEIMEAVTEERLADIDIRFRDASAACVVMASKGYPLSYETGYEISREELEEDVYLFIAGAGKSAGKLVSGGGRVLCVTALAGNLREALEKAYRNIDRIHFENACYRRDIGAKALAAERKRDGIEDIR